MKQFLSVVCLVFAMATVAHAQVPAVKNPVGLAFTSSDHNNTAVTGYEIDIVRPDGTVAQTLTIAKSATTVVAGEVVVALSVQPIAFGSYTFRARTVASVPVNGSLVSVNSVPSDSWDRVPGAPSKPKVQ